jgi:quinol monooxygenase YgiN
VTAQRLSALDRYSIVAFSNVDEDREGSGDAAGARRGSERSGGMHARSTTVHGNPAALQVGIAYVNEAVMPTVLEMDGCIGLSMLVDRESGRSIITSSWTDAEPMHQSALNMKDIRRRTAEILCGATEVQQWEIAVLHRQCLTGHANPCARVVWTEGDPAAMEHMIDTFRVALVPGLDELPGFCSVSLMIDREAGRAATAVTYENRSSMEEAGGRARLMRKEFLQATSTKMTGAASFDLVLAHLRVPETV